MLNRYHSQISDKPESSQQEQLLNFCDEFSEFTDYSAFFCESVSAIVNDQNLIDKASSQGLKRYAQSLKDQSRRLQSWLQQIQTMGEQQQGYDGQIIEKQISR